MMVQSWRMPNVGKGNGHGLSPCMPVDWKARDAKFGVQLFGEMAGAAPVRFTVRPSH